MGRARVQPGQRPTPPGLRRAAHPRPGHRLRRDTTRTVPRTAGVVRDPAAGPRDRGLAVTPDLDRPHQWRPTRLGITQILVTERITIHRVNYLWWCGWCGQQTRQPDYPGG